MGNPFSVLALKKSEMKHTPPFSRSWIKDHILAPGALNNLNQEAADVLLERQGLLERDADYLPLLLLAALVSWLKKTDLVSDPNRLPCLMTPIFG